MSRKIAEWSKIRKMRFARSDGSAWYRVEEA